MNTIYQPKGAALEYGEYALNIYNGCPHTCSYCFTPLVLRKDRESYHKTCEPRANIVEETKKYLDNHIDIKGKHLFLCFTNDPFPNGYEHLHKITYDIIDIIHTSGNYVQLLTKGEPLIEELQKHLGKEDIYGITISCGNELAKEVEPKASRPTARLEILGQVKNTIGCKTFVSCEPVIEPSAIYYLIENYDFIDQYKIGKLNYAKPSDYGIPNIDWKEFGNKCVELCEKYHRNYYIKDGLKKEMKK